MRLFGKMTQMTLNWDVFFLLWAEQRRVCGAVGGAPISLFLSKTPFPPQCLAPTSLPEERTSAQSGDWEWCASSELQGQAFGSIRAGWRSQGFLQAGRWLPPSDLVGTLFAGV